MSGSRRENAYVNFDLHKKKIIFVHFVPIFLQIYSIVPFSTSYKSSFFIVALFWGENVIE